MDFLKRLFRLSNTETDGKDTNENKQPKKDTNCRFKIIRYPLTGRYYVKDGNEYLESAKSWSGIICTDKDVLFAEGFQNYHKAEGHLNKYKEQQGLIKVETVYAE